jgi:DNA-binding transcriptional MocR family regulator
MPSVRDLMARHRAGPVTVQRAVARLAEEGLVEPRPGRGTFVAERRPAAVRTAPPDLGWQALALGDGAPDSDALHRHLSLPPAGAISLSVGYPDESLQPTGLLAQAMARAARRPGSWARIPTEGIDRLRAWFALQAGGLVRPHDVVITPGAQAGLSTAMRVLAPPGSPVLIESPTYLGAIGAAARGGPAARAGPRRSRRRAPRPARRGLRPHRCTALRLPAAVRQPDRRDARARPPRGRARRGAGGKRLPRRGRLRP